MSITINFFKKKKKKNFLYTIKLGGVFKRKRLFFLKIKEPGYRKTFNYNHKDTYPIITFNLNILKTKVLVNSLYRGINITPVFSILVGNGALTHSYIKKN